MKKNIVIIILSVITLGLGGYLVYDKVIDKDEKNIDNEIKEESYDLALAEELVEKYASNSGFLGGDIFREGLTERMKMLIALNNVTIGNIGSSLCSQIYGETYEKSQYGEYFIPLDTSDNISAVCNDTVESIHYLNVDYVYKNLFGTDMPKEDMVIGTYRVDYREENESYFLLDCNCGGADPTMSFYGIKDSMFIGNELVINIVYSIFTPDDNLKEYTTDFDETIKYTVEEINNNKNFSKELINKYADKMKKYKFVFEKQNENYILKDIVNE